MVFCSAKDHQIPIGQLKETWLEIKKQGVTTQLKESFYIKAFTYVFPLLALMPVQAGTNAQVKGYAEMICGINLKTAETEDPEIKKRCMSGLIRHGKKALRISGSSIQRCKAEEDFFSCIKGIKLTINHCFPTKTVNDRVSLNR